MFEMVNYFVAKFQSEDDGLALTEYLVLLGLLIGGVIVAVTAFGAGLSNTWNGWSAWFQSANVQAP